WRRALKAAGVADDIAERVVRDIADSYVGWQENSFPGLLGNVAAGRIANRLDLGGTNCVIDAACASSLGALNLALLELASGRCDMALSGGLDTFNDIFMFMCFSKTPALSPTGDARPFDAACDGTILGEGLGILVLKRLDDARRDGDRVYAVLKAVGTSSDGKGNAVYAPSAAGQAKALRQAYALAGISPATVELIEAHGTGTKVGDATELAALNEVYREARPGGTWCALGSIKSQIGHTKAAAGAAGLIKAALALHRKVLPPTAKVTRPLDGVLPGASPFFVNTEARPWMRPAGHPRRAAVSSFGFGGSNFHCVLEEAGPAMPGIDWDGDVQIVAVSADSRGGLLRALDVWPERPAWEGLRVEAARSRARFDPGEACRLLLVVDRERTDPAALRAKARALVAEGAKPAPDDGIYLGIGQASGGLAMLFPGQGAQHVGMLRALACQFPMMHEALAEADAAAPGDNPRLSDLIYPHPAFSEGERARQEAALRATEVAQPALGAVSLGVLGILEHFGVRPDAVAGHSFGELSALCAAGRIDAKTLASLARLRGRLMADRAHPGDGGTMLAVMAPLDRVEAVVRGERLDAVVANKNAPRQAVLSGPAPEITRAARAFERLRVPTQPLEVSAAFHSRFVAGARGPFLEALRDVAFRPSRVPVFANTTAAPYPDDPDAARALLAGQLAAPVEFVAEVEAMYRSGLRTFLEVGPDARLTGLVAAILDGRPHAALAVDATRGRRGHVADLARALAHLAALGHPVRLPLWDEGVDHEAPVKKPTLTVKVCGANTPPRPKPTPTGSPTPSSKARPDEPAGPCGITGGDDIFAAPWSALTQPSPTRGEGLLSSASPGQEFLAEFEACAMNEEGVLSPSFNQEFPAGFEARATKGEGVLLASSHLVGEYQGGGARQGLASRHHESPPMSQPGTRRALEDGGRTTAPETSPSKSARPAAANQAATSSRFSSSPVAPTNGDIAEPHGLNGTHDDPPMSPTSTNGTAPSSSPTDRLRHPVPPVPAPTPRPILRSGDPAFLEQALRAAQENLIALQKISEQTSRLHRQFLDGQDKTQRAFQSLLEQQQRLVLLGASSTAALPQGLGSVAILDPRHEHRQPDPRPAVEGARAPMPSDPDSLPEGPRTESLLPVGSAVRTDSGDGNTRAHAQDGPHSGPYDRLSSTLKGQPAESLGQGDVLSSLRGWNPDSSSELADPGRASWATDCRPFGAQEHDPGLPFVDPRAVVVDAHLAKTEVGSAVRTDSVDEDSHAYAQEGPLCGPSEDLAPRSSLEWAPPTDPRAVQGILLEVVAEKTGYPVEMLEPDMQLDADLGIDSIKRVEILSALQERLPEAPMIQPEHLGTLRTLRQIAEFLGQGASGSPIAPADSPESSMSPPALTLAPGKVQEVLLEVEAEKTGYPEEMLEPGMQLDADLGIDSIKRVEILSALQERLPEAPAIQPEHLGTLRTLGQI
ncbi:MAG: acyltransferase domain-containing protein, partial [Planctomycetaceae bacterium]|nr:acyltransferase domain-containing protein [Planctomycetaceae bacterium]